MLIRLLPEQIAKLWDAIKYALESSPPVVVELRDSRWVERVLEQSLNGSVEVWASYHRTEDGAKFEGFAITSFEIAKLVKQKFLLIYYVFALRETALEAWTGGLEVLKEYAKSRGCMRVVAYSNVPEIIKISKKLGGDVSTTFITFDIGD